ncbi:hypothetical protein ICL81_00245 [Leucobacter sp. cx-328]|uniref:Rv3654c family TadE-like protein n=1 Tax=unclassified Leucobacter TaxID=2621730 RepID=UPI00165D63A7|nr:MULTISPECIES: Rv3654c family TadE-like protein [unclassified Leucobacter]MBC9942957.1 hypothetical protein [Leucobacter sp. cx-328]MBC9953533.1 hypothetical protein [Leucobacter sp. cx-42]
MSVPIAIGCVAAIVICGGIILAATHHSIAAAAAAGAADSAALAAADALAGYLDAEPCAIAQTVAAAVGASITECVVNEVTASVLIGARIPTALGGVNGTARAGQPVT